MSKLGKKRVCKKCRTPFYDLGKENFSCPKCNPNNSANHKARSKSNPEDAKQISLELDVFEVVHDEPLIGQGVLSGELELPVSNLPAGWYAVARKNINNQKITEKDHVLFLGEPPLKGIERYLAGNKFKGVGAVTSGRLVSSHRMQLLHWLCNSPSDIKEKVNITEEQSKSLLEGWNLAPEHNILSVFLNEIDLLETQIQQVERSYGADIIATLNNNPFSLVKTVSRFDFSDAERSVSASTFTLQKSREYLPVQIITLTMQNSVYGTLVCQRTTHIRGFLSSCLSVYKMYRRHFRRISRHLYTQTEKTE